MLNTNLAKAVLMSFADCKIASKDMDFKGANIETQNCTPLLNEDGTYNVPFFVTIKGADFNYADESITATKADVSFEVELFGVTHSENTGWEWKTTKNTEENYAITTGECVPNILTYNGEAVINDCDNEDTCYSGGFNKKEDAELSTLICNSILNCTAKQDLIKAFKDMASKIDVQPSECHNIIG
ncbi:MAG: hypothetical protein J6N72_05020 [Psychrobacter sp.]|nr:hypothetical protein [Psychrobacter sp.]